MNKKAKGSFTIEAAYLIPLILLILGVVFSILFYYHDKNVLLGTVHETAAYGASREEIGEDTLEHYFTSEIKGKLFLFTSLNPEVQVEKEKVTVSCNASKKRMSLRVACSVNRTNPEDYIRNVRKLIKIGEGMENQK